MDEEVVHNLIQQELLKLKKEVMEALRKQMKEMIFNECMKTATPRIPLGKQTTLEHITKNLEGSIAKVRQDLKELVEKLPDPKKTHPFGQNVAIPYEEDRRLPDDFMVSLNVGGHTFQTRIDTLRRHPATLLGMMASGHPFFAFDNHRPKGDMSQPPFFDRNVVAFEHILEFYRSGELHKPPTLAAKLWRQELDFWNIPWDGNGEATEEVLLEKKKKHKRKSKGSRTAKRELSFRSSEKPGEKEKAKEQEEQAGTSPATSRSSGEVSTDWRSALSPRWCSDDRVSKGVSKHSGNNDRLDSSDGGGKEGRSGSGSLTIEQKKARRYAHARCVMCLY